MCGDDEEHDHEHGHLDDALFHRFLHLTADYNIEVTASANGAPASLADEKIRASYLEGLFRAGLARAVNDAASLPEGDRMDAISGQSIVFARLAGLLAGLFPADSDQFHTIVSAMMQGHNESSRLD
jgi:hypothetical protein